MTSTILLRATGEDDRVPLEAMIGACYGASYRGWYDDRVVEAGLPLLSRIDARLLASGRYFLATCDGQLAGCGGWSSWRPGTSEEEQGVAHIRHFATAVSFMRRGVGGAILRRCVAEARESGFERMACLSSLGAERFYAKHGFARIGMTALELPGGIVLTTVAMERNLRG